MTIDLNVDVGEGFPFDDLLLELATSANVCCGSHAGSQDLTRETINRCQDLGVAVGAHPGLPIRENMGRGPWPMDQDFIPDLSRQVEFAANLGAKYIKPHGTFYNSSASEERTAEVLQKVLAVCGLPLLGLKGTLHETSAKVAGVAFRAEGFVDRKMDGFGRLVDRSHPGAVIVDLQEVLDNALSLATQSDSLCIHGDTPGCVDLLRKVRDQLTTQGFEVRSWS